MKTLATRESVVEYMNEATTEEDWKDRIERVKEANDGELPAYWYDAIVISGLMATVVTRFPGNP